MSEKDKVKFIRLTSLEKKFMMSEQQEFSEMMNSFAGKIQAFWDKLVKARVEELAVAHDIEESYQDGEWSYDTKTARFVKQDKVTPPPAPPEKPPNQKVTETIPGKK